MNAETVTYAQRAREIADGQRRMQEIAEVTKATPVISADARFVAGTIVKHMWIIFVLLPLVIYVLLAALK
jgi:hypothetical protein